MLSYNEHFSAWYIVAALTRYNNEVLQPQARYFSIWHQASWKEGLVQVVEALRGILVTMHRHILKY